MRGEVSVLKDVSGSDFRTGLVVGNLHNDDKTTNGDNPFHSEHDYWLPTIPKVL